ncbi:MAG: hypothetical protein OXB88_10105 [Bacteriovoracales bacterium]|nr:hypothetical protein [Bacteriovoracales bacterium]
MRCNCSPPGNLGSRLPILSGWRTVTLPLLQFLLEVRAVTVRWALLFFFCLGSASAGNSEFRYLHRSSKGLMMGDAYTTLALDSSALFYNPALAARNDLAAIYPLPMDMGLFHLLDEKDRFDNADTNEVSDFVDAIIGLPIHFRAGLVPTIKFGGFTFSSFAVADTHLIVRDRIHPVGDFYYRYDRGFALGFGWMPFGSSRSGGPSLALGASLKYIHRDAIINQYDIFSKTFADLISSDSRGLDGIKNSLGLTKGKGWGADLGVDWRYKWGPSTLALGFSAMDVLDTKIKTYRGSGPMPDQPMALSFGSSFSQVLNSLADWTVSFDLHPLGERIKLKEKAHLGFQMGIPLVDFFVGYNNDCRSYGVAFDLFPFEFAVGVYERMFGRDKKRSLTAHFSLFDTSF